MKAYEISAAASGPRAALAWHGGEGGRDVIHLQWLDSADQAWGPAIPLTDGAHKAYEPDLRLVDGKPLVAWYEKDDAGGLTAWLAMFDGAGHLQWKRALDAAGGQARNPVVRVGGKFIHVAWIETAEGGTPTVHSARLDLAGRPLGAAVAIGEAGADTWNLNAALDAKGRFYVVYDAKQGDRAHELHLSVVRAKSIRTVRLSPDDGHASLYPDLGINARGQAALTWFDERDGNQEVYLAVEPLHALARGRLGRVRRITHTPASSIGAYLAWNGDRLGLVWCDGKEGQNELYGQAFTLTGKPAGGVQRLTRTQTQSSIPSIRAASSGFLIGWNEYETAGDAAHGRITASVAMSLRLPASLKPDL